MDASRLDIPLCTGAVLGLLVVGTGLGSVIPSDRHLYSNSPSGGQAIGVGTLVS